MERNSIRGKYLSEMPDDLILIPVIVGFFNRINKFSCDVHEVSIHFR